MTGSRGYIGRILCPHLVDNGYKVVEFDKHLDNDILDYQSLQDKAHDVEVIVHLAAVVGMKAVDENPQLSKNINIIGTENVLKCNKKTIYTSVLAAFEPCEIVTEETGTYPKHEYYVQKLVAEKLVREADSKNIVLRFGTLYGVSPSMRNDLLIHTLVEEAVRGKIKIFQPEVVRPITSINDAVSSISFFVTSKNHGGLYNIVTKNIVKREIAEMIAKVNKSYLEVVNDEDLENRNYTVSTEKIRRLGFVFGNNLDQSIKEISNYYKGVKI